MSHTLGPWHVVMPKPAHAGRAIWIVDAGQEATIAELRNDARGLDDAPLLAAAPDLLEALKGMNHMGGDERGGYCICPRKDGSAPDERHSTSCADARQAIAKAEIKP